MALLGCIAEDLAGAMAFGAVLTREGMRTVLIRGRPDAPLPDCDALILQARGVAESLIACDALLAAGARQIVQVTGPGFDSPDIGAVADALLRRLQASFAAVVPAYPPEGRSVYLGHLFLNTALAAGEPNLPRRLAARTDSPVGLLPFRIVEEGAGAIRREISRLAEAGRRYAVADALTEAHLRALGAAVAAQALLIGGTGLAVGLPGNLNRAGLLSKDERETYLSPGGACVVLAASNTRVAVAQIGLARLYLPVLDIAAGDGAEEILARAEPQLSDEQPLVIVVPEDEAALLAAIAKGLVARGVRRMLVAGEALGEAVADRLALGQLRIGPEIDPGVPWCIAEGTGLHIAFKPGGAGSRDILLRAFG
jgi:uncharacterized protein YgbK (DUF1537 family)